MATQLQTVPSSDEQNFEPSLSSPARASRASQATTVLSFITVGLITLTVAFFCFYRLGSRSLHQGDESLYTLATQGTLHSSHWWQPMWNGKPYFMTAPLKLWLNMVAVELLGESNFSYRLVDAVAGAGTLLLTFAFGLVLFRDLRIGVVSVIALLGCRAYIFLHGPRQNTLDSLLLFFTTLAIFCGWRLVELAREEVFNSRSKRAAYRWAILGGASLGFGFMTKSVGVFPALGVVGAYAVVSGHLPQLLRRLWPQIALCLGIGILIPLPYYVGHCLFSRNACESLIAANVVHRVTDGYVNQDFWWFYLRRIFVRRELVPPETFAIALLWATLSLKDIRVRFLFVWALVPLIVFSAIPSRLLWYIASAYPAFALLCGASFASMFDAFRSKADRHQLRSAALALAVLVGGGELSISFCRAVGRALQDETRSELDIATQNILRSLRGKGIAPNILAYNAHKLSRAEMPYRNMLQDYTLREEDPARFRELAGSRAYDFFVTKAELGREIVAARPVRSYTVISPTAGRSWPMLVGSWNDTEAPKGFRPVQTAMFLADEQKSLLYGWAEPGQLGSVRYRWGTGPASAILLNVDAFMKTVGLKIVPHLAVRETTTVSVYLNDHLLDTFAVEPGDFHYQPIIIPPEAMEVGQNPLLLKVHRSTGPEFQSNEKNLMLASLRLEVQQPNAEAGSTPR